MRDINLGKIRKKVGIQLLDFCGWTRDTTGNDLRWNKKGSGKDLSWVREAWEIAVGKHVWIYLV